MFVNYDFDRVRASLGNLLHNFDGVDSTLRVVEKDFDGARAVLVSDVPPMSDDEVEVVTGLLEDNGLETEVEGGQVYVTGVSDADAFQNFLEN